MKTTRWDENDKKKCDLCGEVALFDAPIDHRSWGYMCGNCMAAHGDVDGVGTQFDYQPVAKPKKGNGVVKGIELCDIEEQMFGDRMIGCPECECERMVEPDAHYTFDCEGCGAKVKVPMPFC